MNEDIETVNQLEAMWPDLPKGIVAERRLSDGRLQLMVACEVSGTLCLQLIVTIGKRGGLVETIYAWDPTQKVVIDRLLLAEESRGVEFFILPLPDMQEEMKYPLPGVTPGYICKRHLMRVFRMIKEGPAEFEGNIRRMERHNRSVAHVSGGSPGTGVHYRGHGNNKRSKQLRGR